MVTLEAWWAERPVLANARCDVLRGQCRRANAGPLLREPRGVREALALLEARPRRCARRLGRNGRAYFEAHYSWAVIERKYLALLARHRVRGRRPRRSRMKPPASTSSWPRSPTATPSATSPWPSRATCARAGFESDIFAEKVHPRMAHLARPLSEYEQVSSARDGVPLPLLDRQRGRTAHLPRARPPGRRSTTTSRPPISSWASTPTSRASATTAGASSRPSPRGPSSGSGDSEYNRRELEAAGFARTGVLPIVLDFEAYERAAVARGAAALRGRAHQHPLRGPHHPQQEDRRPHPGVRRATSATSTRRSRLLLVGDHRGHEHYYDRLAGAGPRAAARRSGLHRPRGRRRARGLLPGRPPVPVPLRARGLLRAPAGGHALRPARAGLRRGGRARDPARRRGAARARSAPRWWRSSSARSSRDPRLREARAGDPGPRHRARSAGPTSVRSCCERLAPVLESGPAR